MSKWLALLLLMFPLIASAGASRTFLDGATTDFIEKDATPPVAAAPMTFSCWANRDDENSAGALLFIGKKNVGNQKQAIYAFLVKHNAQTQSGVSASAATPSAAPFDEWHLTTGIYPATDDRRVQADAAFVIAEGTNNQNINPTGEDRTSIGAERTSSPVNPFEGDIAHCALWSDQVTDIEIDELAAGQWTSWIGTDNLVGFWPLLGDSPEIDLSTSNFDLTVTGTSVSTDGPPVFFPIGGM